MGFHCTTIPLYSIPLIRIPYAPYTSNYPLPVYPSTPIPQDPGGVNGYNPHKKSSQRFLSGTGCEGAKRKSLSFFWGGGGGAKGVLGKESAERRKGLGGEALFFEVLLDDIFHHHRVHQCRWRTHADTPRILDRRRQFSNCCIGNQITFVFVFSDYMGRHRSTFLVELRRSAFDLPS